MAWFHNGMAIVENGMFKGRGRERWSAGAFAQASVRALLRPTKVNGQPGLVGPACFVGTYCLASKGRSMCPE